MATIVSSTVVSDVVQIDGRRWIREQHVDLLGLLYFFDWMAEVGELNSGQLAAHATNLGNQLMLQEIANNLANAINQGIPPLTYNYSTAAENVANFQAFWATSSAWPCICLGNYISSLKLSDAVLENTFNVTAGAQLTNLKAVLASCVSQYTTGTVTVGI